MTRLPTPGQDSGQWGSILNDFLSQTHTSTGTLRPGVVSSTNIQDGAITSTKLANDAVTPAAIGAAPTSHDELHASAFAPRARYLPDPTGVDDTAAINACLATGGVWLGVPGATYKIGQLVIPSDTTLNVTGCTLESLDLTKEMIRNPAVGVFLDTATDAATTLGSAVITTSVTAEVGQAVHIPGAAGDDIPLYGHVVSVGSGTITISRAAGAAVTGATITVYGRDHDITVLGGRWIRGAVTGERLNGHLSRWRRVDRLTVDLDYVKSVSGGHFAICVGDVTDYVLGVGGGNYARDAIHIYGPSYRGHVTRASGYFADDVVSLTGTDYAWMADTSGDIVGLDVPHVNATTTRALLKVMPGKGNRITGITAGLLEGTSEMHCVWIGEDDNNAGTMGGAIGTVDIRMINATTNYASGKALYLGNPTAELIRAGIQGPRTTANTQAVGIGGETTAFTINRLELNVNVTGPSEILYIGSTVGTIGTIVIDGLYRQVSGSANVIRCHSGTVGMLDLRLRAEMAGGSFVTFLAATATVSTVRWSGAWSGAGTILTGNSANTTAITLIAAGTMAGGNRLVSTYANLVTVRLAEIVATGLTQEPYRTAGGTLTIIGEGTVLGSGTISRAGTETVRVNSRRQSCDISILTPTAGDMANNTNATLACGTGVCISNGTSWKNLYTGAEYTP